METARSPRFARDDVIYRWIQEIITEWIHAMKTDEERNPVKWDGEAYTNPDTVNLELTLRCNLKCKMCQRSFKGFTLPPVTDMTMSMVEKMLPLLTDAKCVWLSGFGEPLMHKDLVPIIQKIRAANKKTEIGFTTNFVLMTDRKLLDIIASGLSLIQVSMDGDNEMGHSFAPTPEGVARYQKILWDNLGAFHEAKQRMGALKPRLQFCFVGMKRNIDQLRGVIQRGLQVGLSSIVVQPVRDYNGSLQGEDLFENRNYALPILDRAREYAHRNGVEFICRFMDEKMSVTRQKCNFPQTFFHVAVNGDVYMCCEGIASNHNICSTDPVTIWNSPAYRQLRLELASGKFRRKCWDCPLVKPTTNSETTLRQGFIQMSPDALAEEIINYRRYIEGCHERERSLEASQSTRATDQDDRSPGFQPFDAYAIIVRRLAAADAAVSSIRCAQSMQKVNRAPLQECIHLLDALLALIRDLNSAQATFPGMHRVIKEMADSAQSMARIIQPVASCYDLRSIDRIISDQLIPTLGVWPGLLSDCRSELHQSLERAAVSA